MAALRARQQRNFLTTLFFSLGVPMLCGGDELCRTQLGNNNAWCQDNELSWYDWDLDEPREHLLAFTKRLIALRREHPIFRNRRFFDDVVGETGLPDAWWFRLDGLKLTQRDWARHDLRSLGLFLNGRALRYSGVHGERIRDDSWLLIFNAEPDEVTFRLPSRRFGERWEFELSTAEPDLEAGAFQVNARGELVAPSRSVTMLKRAGRQG